MNIKIYPLFLIFLLFFNKLSQACNIETNQNITYSGTTYSQEPLTLTHSKKGNGLSFLFNNREFYYNQESRTWCYLEKGSALLEKDICNFETPSPLRNESGKIFAFMEKKDNKIFIWSEQSEKIDKSLPYLVIQDDSQIVATTSCDKKFDTQHDQYLNTQLVITKVSLGSNPNYKQQKATSSSCPPVYQGRLKVEGIDKNKEVNGIITYLTSPSLKSVVQIDEKSQKPRIVFLQSGKFIQSNLETQTQSLEISNFNILITPSCINSNHITPRNKTPKKEGLLKFFIK